MGSGLPQFGFPRRFAIDLLSLRKGVCLYILGRRRGLVGPVVTLDSYFTDFSFKNQ
jgi:hypothetical protein